MLGISSLRTLFLAWGELERGRLQIIANDFCPRGSPGLPGVKAESLTDAQSTMHMDEDENIKLSCWCRQVLGWLADLG